MRGAAAGESEGSERRNRLDPTTSDTCRRERNGNRACNAEEREHACRSITPRDRETQGLTDSSSATAHGAVDVECREMPTAMSRSLERVVRPGSRSGVGASERLRRQGVAASM